MKYYAALVLSAVMMGACAQSAPEMPKNTAAGNELAGVEASKTPELKEHECRICDYDLESYEGDLNAEEVNGLLLALNDEYLATAVYTGVNRKFDNPRPFANIVRAEEQHTAMLVGLFDKYDLPVPENRWVGDAPAYESVKAACEAGVEGEIINRNLYAKLLKTSEREDILRVYRNLQRASEENHKPAFERCAAGGGGGPEKNRGRARGKNS